jgi:hypothetical protein
MPIHRFQRVRRQLLDRSVEAGAMRLHELQDGIVVGHARTLTQNVTWMRWQWQLDAGVPSENLVRSVVIENFWPLGQAASRLIPPVLAVLATFRTVFLRRSALHAEVLALRRDVLVLERQLAGRPTWGAPRIHGELLKLGIPIAQSTVSKYLPRHRKPPSQGWRTFLRNHLREAVAIDRAVCDPGS